MATSTIYQTKNYREDISDQVSYSDVSSSSTATYQTDSMRCIRFGNMCYLTFDLKFRSSQSSSSLAWQATLSGLPPFPGDNITGIGGGSTYSMFRYLIAPDGNGTYTCTIRFIHNGSNGSTSTTYHMQIQYIIDDTVTVGSGS